MDLLFKRYASPFVLLDGVIGSGQLCEFLVMLDEQKKEEDLWEFYVHKLSPLDERSFTEFKEDIESASFAHNPPTTEQLETTIKESFEMINNFNLEEGDE